MIFRRACVPTIGPFVACTFKNRKMLRLLAPNELCACVLRMKPGANKENQENNTELLEKTRKLKIFSETRTQMQMRHIFSELSTEKPFEETLIHNEYSSPFILPYISERGTQKVDDIAIVLNSFLVLCVKKWYSDSEKVFLLFKSFNSLLSSAHLSATQRTTIASAFLHLFMRTYKLHDPDKMEELTHVVCAFFTHSRNIPAPYFEMLALLARKVVTIGAKEFTPLAAELISFVDSLVAQIGDQFPTEHLQNILQLSCGALSGLDTTALFLFSHVTCFFDSQILTAFLSIVISAFITAVEDLSDNESHEYTSSSPISLTDTAQYVGSDVFITHRTFDGLVDLTNTITFSDGNNCEKLVPEHIHQKLIVVSKGITSNEDLVQNFIQMCPRIFQSLETSKHKLAIASIGMLLLREISQAGKYFLPLGVLSHKAIFDPSVTVFDPNDNWEMIDTLRSLAIQLILKEGMNAVQTVLYSNMSFPLLFAELVHRFMNSQDKSIDADDVTVLAQTLMSTMIYYQRFQNLSEESLQASIKARVSLFSYLHVLLNQEYLLTAFFNDEFFVETYLSMIFEAPARPIVLSTLLSYLSLDCAVENAFLINEINNSAKEAVQRIERKEAVLLMTDLLGVLEKAVLFKPKYATLFSSLASDITVALVHIPRIEESKALVLGVLSFLTSGEMMHSISSAEILSLELVIVDLFAEPSPTLFSKIIQLIAGQSLASMHPSFTIRRPKVLRLLIGVFMKSAMLVDAISFIAQLCQSSLKNREEAHRGEFDLYLLDLIDSWRNDSSVSPKTFGSVVSLFMRIAGTVSSVAVVQKFISLLCPIDGKYFPFFDSVIMKSLSSLTISTAKRPVCAVPHNNQAGTDFENLHVDPLKDGMTMTFWINVNETNPLYKPQLLYLSDAKNLVKLGVFLNGNTALAFLDLDGRQLVTRLDHTIETKVWSFLAVSFRVDHAKGHFRVASFYNGEATRDVMLPLGKLQGPIYGRIGGVSADSINVEQPTLTGTVGIFKCLNVDELQHLYELGPCDTTAKTLDPVCLFIPKESSGSISFMNNGSDQGVSLRQMSLRYVHSIPFCDVLVSRCGIDLILPLFAQWDLKFADGTEHEYFSRMTLDILEALLLMSEDGQAAFAASSGFKVIAHLLMSSDSKHITYPLYLKFATVFENLTSERVRVQLLDAILLNIELWLKASAENHRRILRHWARILVPACGDIVRKIRPFSHWLSALRGYYWYEPCEEQSIIVNSRCRGEELNVKECRASIFMIAHMSTFTETDFKSLISCILTCKDDEQIVDFLMFFNEILQERKELLHEFKASTDLICLLQYLFNLKHSEIVRLTLSAIVKAQKSNLIQNVSLEQHVDIMLHQVCPELVSRALLPVITELTVVHPELFPICSWMALNVGEKGMRQMLSKLSPTTSLSSSEFWAVYCVVTLYKCSTTLRSLLSRFLITSATGTVINLFGTVEIVGRALGMDSDPVKHVLLIEYGNVIREAKTDASLDVYEALMRHFLMFRCDECGTVALKSAYSTSPYIRNVSVQFEKKHVMSPKEDRRRARHSLRPDAVLMTLDDSEDTRYSPLLAQKALAYLNPPKPTHQNNRDFKTRRTSLMTTERRKVDVDVQQTSPESTIVSLMPSQLDERIGQIAGREFSYHFGLRLNEHQEWEDVELAKQALLLLQGHSEIKYIETILIISAFLVHFDSNFVQNVLKGVSVPENESLHGALALLNHHLLLMNLAPLGNSKRVDIESTAFDFMGKLQSLANSAISTAPLRFMKHIIKFQATNSEKAFDIFSMISSEIVGMSSNILADYSDSISQSKGKNRKLWRQFWKCVTIDRAPWHHSIPASIVRGVHFKRDMIICGNMCPVKLKQNSAFTDHMDASFLRDSGTVQSAQERFEQYKSDLAKQYQAVSPPGLLEAVVDRDSEQEMGRNLSVDVDSCIIELPCELITVNKTKPAVFSMFSDAVVLSRDSGKITRIKSDEILHVFFRTRFHHPTAIEIFQSNGKTYFINFFDVNSLTVLDLFRTVSLPKIQILQFRDFRSSFCQMRLTSNWVAGKMSNFEYLMSLNLLSGRSFNDASQYPIMPWVIRDYDSTELDLSKPESFRDLSLPMGAMTEKRLQELKEKSTSLTKLGFKPYLFGSGSTNPLTLYLWLMRMEPFTSLHIDMQGGRFDHPARLFSSIEHAWYLSSNVQNDYRELIPEFFCSPEFLSNRDHFNLGKANGEDVDDVSLPKWASTPMEFIYLHRKALESDYVTKHLNEWIDLVWGEKQRGKKAVKANNVFLAEMYNDVWNSSTLSDPTSRAQIEAVMCHVGQVPAQLFDQAHPIRIPGTQREPLISSSVSVSLAIGQIISSSIEVAEGRLKVSALDVNGQCLSVAFDPLMISKLPKGRRASVPQKLSYLPRSASQGRYSGGDMTSRSIIDVPLRSEMVVSNKIVKNFEQIRPQSKIISTFLKDGSLMLVSANKTDLVKIRISTGTVEMIQRHRNDITNISSNDEWVATANRDAELVVFRSGNYRTPVFRIPSFTTSIVCSAVSSSFHSVFVGTRDGSLLFCSLNSGSVVKIVSLGECRPVSIMVTPAWGFVVVYMTKIEEGMVKHILSLFTINGDLIRTTNLEHAIKTWSCFRTRDGFDFITFADDQGDCYIFEAFYLSPGSPFHNSESRVYSIFYMNRDSLAVLVTENGKIVFVPVPLLRK